MVHVNGSFSSSENTFFRKFTSQLRPTYVPPSRYVITNSLLPAEFVRVREEEVLRLRPKKSFTMLVDGWEDILRRSLYGNILAKRAEFPVMLGLKDMTGARASAESVFDVTDEALHKMEKTWDSVIALVTDDPTVMQSLRRKAKEKHRWLIVSVLLDLGINPIKPAISRS